MTEEVLFSKDTSYHKKPIDPKRGRETDIAYDLYTAKDAYIFPGMTSATVVPTGIHTAFDPEKWGLFISPRSSITKFPLALANSTGLIEGEYRGDIGIPLRNTYVKPSFIPDVTNKILTIDNQGNLVSRLTNTLKIDPNDPYPAYPPELLIARELWYSEMENLTGSWGKDIARGILDSTDKVDEGISIPTGSFYLPRGTRIAQAYLVPRIDFVFKEERELPESERGTNGFGSSGVK